jgi:hypothetical protein
MGTKTNPGAFNCYGAALPDEPIFTILGRDPTFRATILYWMAQRGIEGKNETEEDRDRITEAAKVADAGRDWRLKNLDPVGDGVPSWKLPRPEPEPGEDRPIRLVDEATPGLKAVERQATVIKVVLGLRQIAENMRAVNMDANEDWVDRINGFAAELHATFGTDTFVPAAEVETPSIGASTDRPDPPVGASTGKAESDMIDLAEVPESEVPPHRFTHFTKFGRYAYAKGLEVAPPHLPRALDAMTKDGWYLLSIFGQTDSKNVGFIFERRYDLPTVMQEDAEPSMVLYSPYTHLDVLPLFLSTLEAEVRVEVMVTLLHSRGEACRRYVWTVLAAENVPIDPLDLSQLPMDKLGRIAAKLEGAYRDDHGSDEDCTDRGRGLQP